MSTDWKQHILIYSAKKSLKDRFDVWCLKNVNLLGTDYWIIFLMGSTPLWWAISDLGRGKHNGDCLAKHSRKTDHLECFFSLRWPELWAGLIQQLLHQSISRALLDNRIKSSHVWVECECLLPCRGSVIKTEMYWKLINIFSGYRYIVVIRTRYTFTVYLIDTILIMIRSRLFECELALTQG